MLKTRIIPTLLWKDVGLVKGVKFDSWRRVGSILPAVKVYNTRQVDELILLDITASNDKREPDFETVNEVSSECFCPLTVGGGITKIEDIKNLLRAGADKICINSATYHNPQLIKQAANKFGSQCIIVSIDARKNKKGDYECFSHCGSKNTKKKAIEWAKNAEKLGAGEILITSIPQDGTMKGYDLDLIKEVATNVKIPVIASGGAGNYLDLFKAISYGQASAVAAASMFHFTEQTPIEAKKFLAAKGISVRQTTIY